MAATAVRSNNHLQPCPASTRPDHGVQLLLHLPQCHDCTALTHSREQKRDGSIELRAMDTPGEPVLQDAFAVREGIEMVPGTVHLVDSECLQGRYARLRPLLCSMLTLLSARNIQPQASNWQQRRRRSDPSTHKRPRRPSQLEPSAKGITLLVVDNLGDPHVSVSQLEWACLGGHSSPNHCSRTDNLLGSSPI